MASKKARAPSPVSAAIAFGELRAGQRAGGDDRRMVGQPIDALADDRDVGVLLERARHFGGKALAVDRQRRACGHPVLVGRTHDQRAERAHLLVEQPNGVIVSASSLRKLFEQTISARRSLSCAGVMSPPPRISLSLTRTPASASCQAASEPARPPPMM